MSTDVIGGEFKIDADIAALADMHGVSGKLFSSGRAALKHILKCAFPQGKGTVLLPDHICGSVPDTIRDAGMICLFYHIGDDFLPMEDSIYEKLDAADAILLINYFGMIAEDTMCDQIKKIREHQKDHIVIIDNVQDYLGMEKWLGQDYAFTSYRKWFPVPDGASVLQWDGAKFRALHPEIEDDNRIEPVFSKYKFAGNVLKNYRDIIGDDISLKLLEKGEEILEHESIENALLWTEEILKRIDIDAYMQQRRDNARVLHDGLSEMGIPHLYKENAAPLFVPILIKNNRDKIRKEMFGRSVFCPIHWSEDWKVGYKGVNSNSLSDMELSLICDQRYGINEMNLQLEILRNGCADI